MFVRGKKAAGSNIIKIQQEGKVMEKFDFSILTRDGQKVDSIVIAGRDQEEAERKLRQMYRYCEIVSCNAKGSGDGKNQQVMSVEDILSLISK
jgi:hypothetical protein